MNIILYCTLIIVAVVSMTFLFSEEDGCHKSGGVMVRTMFGYSCISVSGKPSAVSRHQWL